MSARSRKGEAATIRAATASRSAFVRVSDLLYVRFHRCANGPSGSTAGLSTGVWLYFNNDWEAFAVRNAERLRELLDSVAESAYSGVDGTS